MRKDDMTMMNWKPASVGCHWFAERETRYGQQNFAISTHISMREGRPVVTFPDSGYVLCCNTNEIGIFKTLKAARVAAERTPQTAYVRMAKSPESEWRCLDPEALRKRLPELRKIRARIKRANTVSRKTLESQINI